MRCVTEPNVQSRAEKVRSTIHLFGRTANPFVPGTCPTTSRSQSPTALHQSAKSLPRYTLSAQMVLSRGDKVFQATKEPPGALRVVHVSWRDIVGEWDT